MIQNLEAELKTLVDKSVRFYLKREDRSPELPFIIFEIPKEKKFGDLSTQIALRLAKELGRSSRDIAQSLANHLQSELTRSSLKKFVEKVAVEGPGFINFYLTPLFFLQALTKIQEEKSNFGRLSIGKGIKVLMEFVSANPTGPLTIAHGRQAALGDSLARIFEFCGYEVQREYYLNDAGVQMETLGRSLYLRYLEELGETVTFPEEGYKGEYIRELAKQALSRWGDKRKNNTPENLKAFQELGCQELLSGIRKDLEDFDVKFDSYFSEQELKRSGKIEQSLEELKRKKVAYQEEGALWFRSTDFGDDKNRVLIKSDGSYTYLAPDIAYHEDKFRRKFKTLINIWGPDHHGYIPRLLSAMQALGYPRESLRILIAQLVTLYEGKKVLRMSTRAGEFVTLREVMAEVGKDACRFFFVMRKFDSHLDFDLELAKKETAENPVYYIQYAHARISSILRLHHNSSKSSEAATDYLNLIKEPEELALIKTLTQFPQVVLSAERTCEPYRLVPYFMELAASFHQFYTQHRVINDDLLLTRARLYLVECVQIVLANGLRLLGVSAPEKM